jgi:hypothetical protein
MFNPADPFDAAALYDMWFNCSECDAILGYDPQQPIDLDYYHLLGQEARRRGWQVRPVHAPAGALEGESIYQVYCPACAGHLGKEGLDGEHQVPDDISALCQSLASVA